MSLELARAVADAVLYEGYLLYPYRSTSPKNQVRWQFGVLGPPGAARHGVGEDPAMHAECLLTVEEGAELTFQLRFLQLQTRVVEAVDPEHPTRFVAVDRLAAGGTILVPWDEAVERTVELGPFAVGTRRAGYHTTAEVAGGDDVETVTAADGGVTGRVVRRRWPLAADIDLEAGGVESPGTPRGVAVVRLAVHVENSLATPPADRDEATRTSFLGAHLLLQVERGAFVSLLEPPAQLAAAAAECRNERCWPVLVGADGQTDVMLASPIILYDYPAIAPESAGALFDSTEIDEILTLRVMTMTDDEKAEARATDPAAAAIIDRCDSLSPEALQKLHGVLRDPHGPIGREPSAASGALLSAVGAEHPSDPYGGGLRRPVVDWCDLPTLTTPGDHDPAPGPGAPWWDPGVDGEVSPSSDAVMVDGVAVAKGSLVRLHPQRNADAQDLFFAGRTATVSAVYFDVDGETHVAVVLTDDPAADLHEWYGRYLYFAPEEIEPIGEAGRATTEAGITKERLSCEPLDG